MYTFVYFRDHKSLTIINVFYEIVDTRTSSLSYIKLKRLNNDIKTKSISKTCTIYETKIPPPPPKKKKKKKKTNNNNNKKQKKQNKTKQNKTNKKKKKKQTNKTKQNKCPIAVSNPNNKILLCTERESPTPNPLSNRAVDIRGVITCIIIPLLIFPYIKVNC